MPTTHRAASPTPNRERRTDAPVRVDRKRNKIFRFCKRCFKWTLLAVLAYIAILLIGLIPVNNDFVPAENGVTIYVISNAVHADIIVPCENEVFNWNEPFGTTDFVGDVTGESHVAIGWGDRGFFLETQTWDDFKLSTAVNALLVPSECCLHVSYTRPDYYLNPTAVTISNEQYKTLVEFIDGSFKKDANEKFIQIEGEAYSTNDAFFTAKGNYHMFNTCNSWVGRALKSAGVRVPWLSPMPKSPMLYIESSGQGTSD